MKKILLAILALLIISSCAAGVYADDVEEKRIEVSYRVVEGYEISIPPVSIPATGKKGIRFKKGIIVIPAEGDAVADFTVELSDVLLEKETVLRVSVESENGFNLLLPNGVSVPYSLIGADEDKTVMVLRAGETTSEKILTVILGDTSGLSYAGTYNDTLTFNCEILPEN